MTSETSTIEWVKADSSEGKKFEVGIPAGSGPAPNAPDTVAVAGLFTRLNPFGITVNWTVDNGSETWNNTSDEVKKTTGITRYRLLSPNGFYRYRLEFTNVENYNYTFSDETGDTYGVNTWSNGDHSVRYDSQKPNDEPVLFS